jgi:ABC-type lipoprotein export system ATPase subunit
VIATHNSAHAAWADRVIHLRDGALVERATAVLDRPMGAASGRLA